MKQAQQLAGAALKPARCTMEIVISVVVSLVAVAAIIFSRKFPTTGLATDIGSARFPLIYSCALIVLCAILIGQNLLKGRAAAIDVARSPAADDERPNYRKTFAGIVSSVLGLVAMPYLGYALVTVGYLSFLMWLLGMKHKAWNPLLALTTSALLYFTFSTGLNVPLPVGSLFE